MAHRHIMLGSVALAVALAVSMAPAASADIPQADGTDDTAYVSPITYQLVSAYGATDKENPLTIQGLSDYIHASVGDTPAGFKELVLQEAAHQRALYPQLMPGAPAQPGIPAWTSLGPTRENHIQNGVTIKGVDSGRLSTILPHPTDPNTVYVLASSGGLWKTTNFTAPKPTWVPKTDGIFSTIGGGVAFGRDPNTLYLGLGDPFNLSYWPTIGGVMLTSTDGGDSWSPFVDMPGAGTVLDVKVDTSGQRDIVLVGTDDGLWRSADGGATYTQVAGAGLLVWSMVRTSAGWLASIDTQGPGGSPASNTLYLSTDHGATWQPITNVGNGYSNAGRTTLAVGAPGDSVVYAFAAVGGPAGNTDQGDLFRSTDGGQSWTPLHITGAAPSNPNPDQPTMDLMSVQAGYNQMILVDPTDPTRNTVYLGGQLSAAKSTNGGATWTLISNWLAQFGLPYIHADFHTAAFSTIGGQPALLFGSDGGLFVSGDGGATWDSSKNEGLVTAQVYAMASTPSDSKSVLIGLQDEGTRIRQGNTTLYNETFGGDGFGVGWSQANDAAVLGSVYFSDIFVSTKTPNKQKKWTAFATNGCILASGIDRCDSYFITPLTTPSATADPTGQVFFTDTFHHIYKTTDGGYTWQPIYTAPTSNLGIRGTIHAVGVSPVDTNHIGAAGFGGRLFLTADGGQTWTVHAPRAFVPAFPTFISSVAWANNSVLYVSSESQSTSPNAARVVKSTNGGQTWSAAGAGLPLVPVFKLLVSPRDPSGNTVYAATLLGVYQTTDGGASWHLFGAGLPHAQVSDLYMPPDGGFLRIATYGRGIWEITP